MKRPLPILLLAVVVAGGCSRREQLRQRPGRLDKELQELSESKTEKREEPASTNFSPDPAPFDSVAIFKSPLIMKDIYGGRSPGPKGRARATYGGSGMTEGAVLRCLRWLKKIQHEDGSWGGKDEPKPVATGIALLTFLAHGESPASEEFGQSIKGASQFLLSLQNQDGTFNGTDENPTLQHAIVTCALCETYGLTRIPTIKPVCEKAVELIINGQNLSGLWGMEYRKDDDLEASVWQVRALRSAWLTGLNDEELRPILKKAAEALKKTIAENAEQKKTAPAAHCLQLIGFMNDPTCKSGLAALDGLTMNWEEPEFENPVYHWHFITQAKFHQGGRAWSDWNRSFAPELVRRQHIIPEAVEGSRKGRMVDIGYWTSPGKNERYGKTYASALCCLMLENYYRYLPMFRNPIDLRKKDASGERGTEIDIEVTP